MGHLIWGHGWDNQVEISGGQVNNKGYARGGSELGT